MNNYPLLGGGGEKETALLPPLLYNMSWITKDGQTYYGIEMTQKEAEELTERINELNTANFEMEQAKLKYEEAKKFLEEYLAELQKPSRRKRTKATPYVPGSENESK